jgi:hypothetical protein
MVWHATYSIAFFYMYCINFSAAATAAIVPYNIVITLYNSEVKLIKSA